VNTNKQKLQKERKTTDGSLRNKERTKQKWLDAVGEVLKEKGYAGLTVKNITKQAGMDRRLIALYFGNVDNLIETYLQHTDYWMTKVAPKFGAILNESGKLAQQEITSILHLLFDEVLQSTDLQRMLSWEVGEYHPELRKLADNREILGKEMFKLTDVDFEGTKINIRAMLALQIAGIYYLAIHAKVNGSTFCQIDVNTPKGKEQINVALSTLMQLIYNEAGIRRAS
jgi:AcrR family transcriptional regulator